MMISISRPSTNRSARRSLATLFLLLLLALIPSSALAEEGESFKSRYEKAVALYTSGQYDRAIEEFRAVYEIKQAPILLFNIAQAQRKAKQYKNSLDMYARFLASNPKEEMRTEAEKYVEEAKVGMAEEEKAAKEAAEKAAADKAAADYRRHHGPTRPLNIAKWAVGGAGVIMTIVGAVLVGLDGRPACDVPMNPGQVLCPLQLDTITAGGTLLGVGLAAVGTSAVLFGLDYKQTRDGAQRATATVAMRF